MTDRPEGHHHPVDHSVDPAPPAQVSVLSRRDVDVLQCLADGKSTSQIAGVLEVSGNTARTRIHRVEAKLDVTDRAAAVRTAKELGVVGIPRPRRPVA
jgi:ATP/maltotriose-dependent transcriptional regulator MalT